jgi:excisionase family DNA binding protein
MLTVAEAAVALSLSKSYVKKLVSRGVLASVKVGRSRRVRRVDLDHYVATLRADLVPPGQAGPAP